MISEATIVRRKPELISVESDGEAVVLDAGRGDFLWLSVTGARIWALLDTPQSIAELCAALERDFAVDHATCLDEVLGFLRELDGRDLVEFDPPAAG